MIEDLDGAFAALEKALEFAEDEARYEVTPPHVVELDARAHLPLLTTSPNGRRAAEQAAVARVGQAA